MAGRRENTETRMKILITGSSGMLGRTLYKRLSDKYEIIGLDVVQFKVQNSKAFKGFIECDIVDRGKTVAEIVSVKPDIVIHAAAYTDVDGCEQNPEKAYRINAKGTENVALACKECESFLTFISTDFVFDGEKSTPYAETDLPHPINIYGQSKLEGEKLIQSTLDKYIIIRTSWLYASGGKNFVDTILNKAETKKELKVVQDQQGTPTYAEDLAQAVGKLMDLKDNTEGIFHITNSGSCSWYEFARTIKDITNFEADIIPVNSEQYSQSARRPKMSALDSSRYQNLVGEKLRPWKEALREYLEQTDECEKTKRQDIK